jgi:hypothetical protein
MWRLKRAENIAVRKESIPLPDFDFRNFNSGVDDKLV